MTMPKRKREAIVVTAPNHPHLEIVRVERVTRHDGAIGTEPVEPTRAPACAVDDIPDVADYQLYMPLNILHHRREATRTRPQDVYTDPYAKYKYEWLGRAKEVFDLLWCRFWHDPLKWDGGPHYECHVCHKKYAVAWAKPEDIVPGVYFWQDSQTGWRDWTKYPYAIIRSVFNRSRRTT